MTLGIAPRRAKSRWVLALVAVTALVLTATSLVLASISSDSGFEGADGNLAPSTGMDWNSFAPVTWTGSSPYQTAETTVNGWAFTGITDAEATNSDTGFAGGTKQDDECATVKGTKAPNKDDLKRIYVASQSVGGHVYLGLAWERIPQNSTTASAHVGFEFNQGTAGACAGASSDGLVKRVAGDLLFVYDFTGGSAGVATLTVRTWTTTPGDACDIGSDAPPCWGIAEDLTAGGFAEAAVDSGATGFPFPVTDSVAPGGDSLGQSEFGEAIADLTDAGVFGENACTTFGHIAAVSRSSGNSGNAQMEDLVGPANLNISNCGTVKIIKHTDPRGLDQDFGFTASTGLSPSSFTLNDNATNTQTFLNVQPGTYTVTEGTEPDGYLLESLTCTASGSGASGSQHAADSPQADITVTAGSTVTCTYTNQATGTINIIKQTDPRGVDQDFGFTASTGLSPSSFTLNDSATNTQTFNNVPVGEYSVTEGTEPTGFQLESVSCTTGGSQDTTNDFKANISLTAGATVTCTFTNEQQGTVTIIKHTNPSGLDQDFSYTTDLGTGAGFTLNDSGTDTKTFSNVPPDTYTVTEGTEPNGFALGSLTCDATGTGSSGSQHATDSPQADITVGPGGSVTCTYVNDQLYGAILITKESSKPAATPLDGATFTITGPDSYSSGDLTTTDNSATTGDGTVCVDGLVFGDYTVTETAAPSGYAIDTTAGQTVTVNNAASCSDAEYGGETITFKDTPLTDIYVSATSEATGGTKSQISCVNKDTSADIGDSPSDNVPSASVTANGVEPGTYVCTIVVDP